MPPKKGSDRDGAGKEAKPPEGAGAAPEATDSELQMNMLIAATFANDELASKAETLNQYYQIAARLKDDNERLRDEMVERDRDSLQVVEFLRREVERKQETVETLKVQLEEQKEKSADAIREREEDLLAVVAEKDALLDAKHVEIARLEEELESVARHKRAKHEMEDLVATLQQSIADTKERYEKELSRLRFQSLEDKVRLKHEEKDLNDKFSRAVNHKAMELLDGQTRQIHAENTELLVGYHKLEQEYMTLTKQSKGLEDAVRQKDQEIELAKHSLAEYSRQSYSTHKSMKELTSRNKALEANTTQIVQLYDTERQNALQTRSDERDVLAKQLHDTRQALRIRTLELHRIKRLAKVIIQQRTELELFFTEALDYVKQEIIAERVSQGRPQHATKRPGHVATQRRSDAESSAAPSSAAHTPSRAVRYGRRGSSGGSNPANNTSDEGEYAVAKRGHAARSDLAEAPPSPTASAEENAQRLDISELGWVDKERVLRILFAKISQVCSCASPTQLTHGGYMWMGQPTLCEHIFFHNFFPFPRLAAHQGSKNANRSLGGTTGSVHDGLHTGTPLSLADADGGPTQASENNVIPPGPALLGNSPNEVPGLTFVTQQQAVHADARAAI